MPANADTSWSQGPPLPGQPWNRPILAHVYTNAWVNGGNNAAAFKKLAGPLVRQPTFKYTALASQQPITIHLPTEDTTAPLISNGDIIQLTEQWGDGSVIYGGMVTDIGDTIDPNDTSFPVRLTPLSAEAALYPFSTNYTAATDLAQMVRDAFSNLKHVTATTATAPNSGKTGIYDFSITGTPLKVIDQALKMTGGGYQWYIDPMGQVWFGAVSTASATYTVKRGIDYHRRVLSQPIDKRYNYFVVLGGVPPGQNVAHPVSIACVYDAGHIIPCTSATIPAPNYSKTDTLGVRARMPHFRIPKLLDQTTLNNIAQAIGANLNRANTKIELTLFNFPQRISLAGVNGATMRYWEPSANEGLALGDAGSGGYSPIYLITDLEVTGNVQKVILTDVVQDDSDIDYWLETMLGDSTVSDNNVISTDSVGVITPGNLWGATGGGPAIPTTPALYP